MPSIRAVTFVLVCALVAGLLGLSAVPASAVADKFALIVGVAQYQRSADLPGSDGDAHDTRQFLLGSGWSAGNVHTLVNQQATAPAIREELKWLATQCVPGTTCVFKFSGHIKQSRAADGDNESMDENLLTTENALFSDGELADSLTRIAGRAWIDISGCEAAGFDDGVSSAHRVFTGSSQENEKSYESPVYRNSVWTELLVNQGLAKGKNLADAFNFAKPQAAKETAGQRRGPQNAYIAGGDPQSWFNRPAAPAPAARSGCLLGFLCL